MPDYNIVLKSSIQRPDTRAFVSDLQSQLKGVSVEVNLKLNPESVRQLQSLNASLATSSPALRGFAANATAAEAASTRMGSSMSRAGGAATPLTSAMSRAGSASAGYSKDARAAADSSEVLAASLNRVTQRFFLFTIAKEAVRGTARALQESFAAAAQFEKQMLRLSQASGESKGSISGIASEIDRVSKGFGVSSTDLAAAAVQMKRAGLTADDVKISMEALGKAALSPSFEDMGKTADAATVAIRQFGVQAKDLQGVLGTLDAVSSKFAVTSTDIAEGIKVAGASFKASGGDLNELIALFTAVKSTSREGAFEVATGLKTIFARMQKDSVVTDLDNLGVHLRYLKTEANSIGDSKLTNQFVGEWEAVKRLSAALSGLPRTDSRFADIANRLGGIRELDKVIPLLENFGEAQRALNVAQAGSVSLSTNAAQAQGLFLTKIAKVGEEFNSLIRSVSESKTFQVLTNFFLTGASAAIKFADAMRPLLPLITAIGVGFVARGAGSFGLRNMKQAMGFAGGGTVPGHGGSKADDVPIMASSGEYILNKAASQAIGYGVLNRWNSGAMRPQRFASGGPIESQVGDFAGTQDMQALHAQFQAMGGNLRDINGAMTVLVEDIKGAGKQFTGFASKLETHATDSGRSVSGAQVGDKKFTGRNANLLEEALASGWHERAAKKYVKNDVGGLLGVNSAEGAAAVGLAHAAETFDPEGEKEWRAVAFNAMKQQMIKEAKQNRKGGVVGLPALGGPKTFMGSQQVGEDETFGDMIRSPGAESILHAQATKEDLARLTALGINQAPDDMSYQEKQVELKKRGLPASGKQDALTGRLVEAMKSQVAQAAVASQASPSEDVAALHKAGGVLAAVTHAAGGVPPAKPPRPPSVAGFEDFFSNDRQRKKQKIDFSVLGKEAARQAAHDDYARKMQDWGEPIGSPSAFGDIAKQARGDREAVSGSMGVEQAASVQARQNIAEEERKRRLGSFVAHHLIAGAKRVEQERAAELRRPYGLAGEAGGGLLGAEGPLGHAEFADTFGLVPDHNVLAAQLGGAGPIGTTPIYTSEEERRMAAASAKSGASERAAAQRLERARKYSTAGGRFSTDALSSISEERANATIAGRGGKDMLSSQTQAALRQEALAKAEQDLIRAETAHAKVIFRGISEEEAGLKAREKVSAALAAEEKVLRDSRGAIIGLSSTAEQLALAGKDATKSPLAGLSGALGGKVGGGARFERLGQSLMQGQFAATIAGGFLAQGLDSHAGTAEDAAASGNGGRFTGYKGAAGALTGALAGGTTGMFVGSAFGPAGTVAGAGIGAVVGASAGLYQSLKDADEDLRAAHLNQTITAMSRRMASFLSGDDTFDTASNSLVGGIREAGISAAHKGRAQLGFFGDDDETYKAAGVASKAEFSSKIGPRLQEMISSVNKMAQDLGKGNAGRGPIGYAQELSSGKNGEIFGAIASLEEIPVDDLIKKFAKVALEAQQSAESLANMKRSGDDVTRGLYNLDRMAAGARAAASGGEPGEAALQGLGERFGGGLGVSRIAGLSGALKDIGSPDRIGFNNALVGVTGQLGEGGTQLAAEGKAANAIRDILPTILAKVLSQNALVGAGSKVDVSGLLSKSLGKEGESPEAKRFIEAISSRLDGEKLPELLKTSAGDVGKASENLTSDFVPVIQKLAEEMAKIIDSQNAGFLGGLGRVSQMGLAIGQQQDQGASLGLLGIRARAGIAGERAGNFSRPLDLISDEQLEGPFAARQRRLAGTNGFNVGAISEELRSANKAIPGLESAAAKAQGTSFGTAGTALEDMKNRAHNLNEALEHLANASERNAAIQERIQSLESDRSSRLSFADKLAHADDNELAGINRGIAVLSQAQGGRNIRTGMGLEDRRLALDTARGFGDATLPGLGGVTGNDLSRQLLQRDYGFAANLPAGKEKERQDLLTKNAENIDDAGKANDARVTQEKAIQVEFFTSLKSLQVDFFARLAAAEQQRKGEVAKTEFGMAAETQANIAKRADQAKLLNSLGISSEEGRQGFLAAKPEIRAYLDAKKEHDARISSAEKLAGDTDKLIGDGVLGRKGWEGELGERLKGVANPPKIVNEFRDAILDRRDANMPVNDAFLKESLGGIIRSNANDSPEQARKLTELRHGIKGVKPETLLEVANREGDWSKITEAATSFSDMTLKIGATAVTFENVAKSLEIATESLKKAEANLPAPAGKKDGGVIFRAIGGMANHPGAKPHYPDTIPAYLSEGEFVVKASQTRKYRGLLERINGGSAYPDDGGGPAGDQGSLGGARGYADGGFASVLPWWLRTPGTDAAANAAVGAGAEATKWLMGSKGRPKGYAAGGAVYLEDGGLPDDFRPIQRAPQPWFPLALPPKAPRKPAINLKALMAHQNLNMLPSHIRDHEKLIAAQKVGGLGLQMAGNAGGELALNDVRTKSGKAIKEAVNHAYEAHGVIHDFLKGHQERSDTILNEMSNQAVNRNAFVANAGLVHAGQLAAQTHLRPGESNSGYLAGITSHQSFNETARLRNIVPANAEGFRKDLGDFIQKRGSEKWLKDFWKGHTRKKIVKTDIPFRPVIRAPNAMAGPGLLPPGFADGGVVDAGSNREGADDVAARLSRGEAVMSRKAVALLGGAAGVNAINKQAKGFADGGVAGATSGAGFPDTSKLVGAFSVFGEKSTALGAALATFGDRSETLVKALTAIPASIKLDATHNVSIVMNGASVFATMIPAIKDLVLSQVNDSLKKFTQSKFPELT